MTELAPNLLHKVLPATGVKTIDEEQGIVEAFVSGIGNKDQVADIIEKGAFIDSLKERMPKGVWSHDWSRPVSKTLEIYEVPAGDDRLPKKMLEAGIGGLYVKTQFNLETQDGRDALSWVKFFGEDSEWSIGYQTKESEYDAKKKAMRLKKIDLYEYSPVLFGANPLTSTVGVKVLINQEGQEKAVDLVLEGVDPELAAKITAAVESVVANDAEDGNLEEGEGTPDTKTGEELVANDETPQEPEVKEGEEGKVKEEAQEPEKKAAEGASDESGAPADTAGSEPVGDEKSGEPEEGLGEWTPAPVVEYAKQMLLGAELSPRDAKALSTFINSRVRANEEGVYPDGTKSLPGSWEERRGALNDCLEEKYPGGSSWVYATFDNTVVFRVYNYLTGEGSYYEASYSMTDGNDVELADVKEVDIIEVVVAKAAVMDAVFKGHGLEIKKLLQPLVELSADVEPDEDIKTVLELALKAGASLSAANRQKIQDAIDTIGAASTALGELITTEEKEEEHEVEVISVANKAGASPTFGKTDEAGQEAEQKAEDDEDLETVVVDLEEFKSLQAELGLD